jgi:hypothetical protein
MSPNTLEEYPHEYQEDVQSKFDTSTPYHPSTIRDPKSSHLEIYSRRRTGSRKRGITSATTQVARRIAAHVPQPMKVCEPLRWEVRKKIIRADTGPQRTPRKIKVGIIIGKGEKNETLLNVPPLGELKAGVVACCVPV